MGKKQEQCAYEAGCMLRSEFGCEVCRFCTVGPRQRAIDRRIRMGLGACIALNFVAMVMNLIRVFTR